jgi:Fe-S-cluster containining protein
MLCNRCGTCCLETEMLLSTKDIEKLIKKGHNIEFFTRQDNEGYIILKNQNGHCVFFDVNKKRCIIYSDRPTGCRLYPIIFDESKGLIIDKVCLSNKSWTKNRKKTTGKKVIELLEKIDNEAKKRDSS